MHFCTSGALPSALMVIQTMLLKSVNLSMMKSITEVQSWTEEKKKKGICTKKSLRALVS